MSCNEENNFSNRFSYLSGGIDSYQNVIRTLAGEIKPGYSTFSISITALQAEARRVWQDKNSDGILRSDELKTLDELGIVSLNVAHQDTNQALAGGRLSQIGSLLKAHSSKHPQCKKCLTCLATRRSVSS